MGQQAESTLKDRDNKNPKNDRKHYKGSGRGFLSGRTPDAGRNVRLFDMQPPVVHTRNNFF